MVMVLVTAVVVRGTEDGCNDSDAGGSSGDADVGDNENDGSK